MNHEDLLVRPGQSVRLADLDPAFTCDFENKSNARDKLAGDIERLAELQAVFYAVQRHALLIVLQGIDCAGKDGAIKHVMSGVNPQGIHVFSFGVPNPQELAHDYLWRCEKALPERGRVAIFNRSYYEDVLAVRVHEDLLDKESLAKVRDGDLWRERYEDINGFERHLVRNGTLIVKFFLHISKDEQRRRLLKRLDDDTKTWKLSASDVAERRYWKRYRQVYQQMLECTSTQWAPWYVIPSNHKWFMRTAIADVLLAQLESLVFRYTCVGKAQRKLLADVREALEREGN